MTTQYSPSPPTLLGVEGVSRIFPSGRGLAEVSFHVSAGEIVGIQGDNGAGKTTLLDVITGTTSPNTGSVELSGIDATNVPPFVRARMGLRRTFQISPAVPALRVVDYVRGLILQDRSAFRSCMAAATNFGIRGSRPMHTLSGGERRMLDVAVCMLSKGNVVLLDEPFAGIAPMAMRGIEEIISAARSAHATVLVVDHDTLRLQRLCCRLISIHAPEI